MGSVGLSNLAAAWEDQAVCTFLKGGRLRALTYDAMPGVVLGGLMSFQLFGYSKQVTTP
jgi:hypothetical protein